MSISEFPAYRLFSFYIDGKPGTLRLDWMSGLSPEENEEGLYQRFHSLMEHRFPGAFTNGRINRVGYVDGYSGQADGGVEETKTFF